MIGDKQEKKPDIEDSTGEIILGCFFFIFGIIFVYTIFYGIDDESRELGASESYSVAQGVVKDNPENDEGTYLAYEFEAGSPPETYVEDRDRVPVHIYWKYREGMPIRIAYRESDPNIHKVEEYQLLSREWDWLMLASMGTFTSGFTVFGLGFVLSGIRRKQKGDKRITRDRVYRAFHFIAFTGGAVILTTFIFFGAYLHKTDPIRALTLAKALCYLVVGMIVLSWPYFAFQEWRITRKIKKIYADIYEPLIDPEKRREAINRLSYELAQKEDAQKYLDRGVYYLLEQDYAKALHDAEKAVGLEPDKAVHHGMLCSVLYESGRHEEALKACKILEERFPVEWATCHFDISLYLERGDVAAARSAIDGKKRIWEEEGGKEEPDKAFSRENARSSIVMNEALVLVAENEVEQAYSILPDSYEGDYFESLKHDDSLAPVISMYDESGKKLPLEEIPAMRNGESGA